MDNNVMRIGDGRNWSFVNGPWVDGSEGELVPPDGADIEYLAVKHDQVFGDFSARFRFKLRSPSGGARLLFRLQDSMRYYGLDIPSCGQQNRNRHFWAGVVLADGTALQRYLNFGLVPGICPELDRWYKARVECLGSSIRAWIEGRPVAAVEDHTYASGRVGLMGLITSSFKTPHFGDLQVTGDDLCPSAWTGLIHPAKHWITPCPEVDPETFQSYPKIIKGKSGKLAVNIPFGDPNECEIRRTVWVRSSDGGHSWSAPEPSPLPQGLGESFVKEDGTWVSVHCKEGGPVEEAMYTIESKDEGESWSRPKAFNIQGEWPKEFSLPACLSGQPLRLRDGTLLVSVYCKVDGGNSGGWVYTNFIFRSTDDGQSWAAPVRCDRNNKREGKWWCPSNFSEIGLAETDDNRILGFGRPGPWPYMWQLQSNDGGQTWKPAAFGPFPGHCITLTSTASGALVAIHRFPYLCANVSYDGGLTWDAGTIIDYPTWANHKVVEVEPDVLLVIYMGHIIEPGQADNRTIRLLVSRQGLAVNNKVEYNT